MTPVPFSYRMAVKAARAAAPLMGRSRSKLGRAIAGRGDAHLVLRAWGADSRRAERPLVWFHAPSVGEGLQARIIMQALRGLCPDLQVAYTYVSPSAEPFAPRFGADVTGYLPWDDEQVLAPVMDALAPDLIVFTRTEVWPALVARARARDTPVAFVAGSVPPTAGRLRWPARAVMRETWSALSAALACHPDDAEMLRRLAVPDSVIEVVGDPAVDAAIERLAAAPGLPELQSVLDVGCRPIVVAGSTWPGDELILLQALSEVRSEVPEVRVVFAPHEPTADRVGRLIGDLMERGWHPSTLAHAEADGGVGQANAIVVERVGVLARLYTVADVAYVGGGFHGPGVHSVVEPAAAGLGALIGPRHEKAPAAGHLVRGGGAVVVEDPGSARDAVVRWLSDPEAKRYASRQATGYIEEHRGAALRTARTLESLLSRSRAS